MLIRKANSGLLGLRDGQAGFTLVEIMAAVAILGLSVFILLDAHYSALRLHEVTSADVTRRVLLESVVGKSEAGVLAGKLSDAGDFGGRYPDYGWSYEAAKAAAFEEIPLYRVRVSVAGPEGNEALEFYVYNGSVPEEGLPTTRTPVRSTL